MNRCARIEIFLVIILGMISCSGPTISVEEEKVLAALSNIQQSLESNASYEEFSALLGHAKNEIDILKNRTENNSCFMGAIDQCYAFYHTGGKAWQQKMKAADAARKHDMDLTLSVLQSRAALTIQMAGNCYQD